MKLLETSAAVDRKGRLHIPAEIFEELELMPGDEIRILLSDNPDFLQAVWRALLPGDGSGEEPESGEKAGGFLLSAEMLDSAGFRPGEPLQGVCGDRKIQITALEMAPVRADPINRLPRDLRKLCDDLGLDPDTVRKVMEEGEYFK